MIREVTSPNAADRHKGAGGPASGPITELVVVLINLGLLLRCFAALIHQSVFRFGLMFAF